jgi:hypothetical protein
LANHVASEERDGVFFLHQVRAFNTQFRSTFHFTVLARVFNHIMNGKFSVTALNAAENASPAGTTCAISQPLLPKPQHPYTSEIYST